MESIITAFLVFYYIFFILIIYIIYKVLSKSAKVHHFKYDDIEYPSFLSGSIGEKLIVYAYSISGRNKFYVSNKRVILLRRNLVATKNECCSIPISTINTSKVFYSNPYWLLILAAINIFYSVLQIISSFGSSTKSTNSDGFILNHTSSSDNTSIIAIIISLIFYVSIWVSLWLYFRGYKIIIKNPSTTFYLSCRNRTGLLDLVRKIELYRLSIENLAEIDFNNLSDIAGSENNGGGFSSNIEQYSDKIESAIKNKLQAGRQKIHKMTAPSSNIATSKIDSLDQTCNNCNSILTLESEDLKQDSYTCPICSTTNPIKK